MKTKINTGNNNTQNSLGENTTQIQIGPEVLDKVMFFIYAFTCVVSYQFMDKGIIQFMLVCVGVLGSYVRLENIRKCYRQSSKNH